MFFLRDERLPVGLVAGGIGCRSLACPQVACRSVACGIGSLWYDWLPAIGLVSCGLGCGIPINRLAKFHEIEDEEESEREEDEETEEADGEEEN